MAEVFKEFSYGGRRYIASSDGYIISSATGKVLHERINSDGYKIVSLGADGERDGRIKVHRIIAELFVDNPYGFNEVNHIDFNRQNNKADNLNWMTHKDNVSYSVAAGHYTAKDGENNGRSRLTKESVSDIKLRLMEGEFATAIAREYGVGASTIYNIKLGNTWKSV